MTEQKYIIIKKLSQPVMDDNQHNHNITNGGLKGDDDSNILHTKTFCMV